MMKISNLILSFGLFFPIFFFGQGENNNWYFGFGAGIHFNSDGSVTALEDGQLTTYEGCAAISDPVGNLLFYTDGATVYDRNHNIMQNGTGLYGNPSSTQSAIIVPKPDDPDIYFIFTVGTASDGVPDRGLNYSIVDISLNNGFGTISRKNVNLLEDCAEKITAVIKDCNEKSIWIVTFSTETGTRSTNPNFNTFHAFEFNNLGVINTAVTTTFNSLSVWDVRGYLKFSLDASKLVSANAASGLYLYDFDVNTGVVSNQEQISITAGLNRDAYGVEFSPSGQYLYVIASNNLYSLNGQTSSLLQYDLWSTDISGSQVILESRDVFRGALQLGTNGKIYRALSENYNDGIPYLGVINTPNEAGLSANYQHNGPSLGSKTNGQGLPSLVQSFFTEIKIVPDTVNLLDDKYAVCVGDPITLEAQQIPGATYSWEKDNIPFINPDNHIFQVASADVLDSGNYRVTIIRPNASACPIIGEVTVLVDQFPEANTLTIVQCDMEDDNSNDGIGSVDLTQKESNSDFSYYYYETITDRDNDNPISTPESYRNTLPFDQLLYYKISNISGCENLGELQLYIQPMPSFSMEDTYLLCTNDPALNLTGPEGFDAYRWLKIEENTEFAISATQAVDIFEIGSYRLEATSIINQNGETLNCTGYADFEVLPSNPAIINAIDIKDITANNTVEIEVLGDGDYEYSLDGSSFQDSNFYDNVPSGIVTVYVRDKNGCGLVEETIEIDPDLTSSGFPKFFTPNGDGINDYWQFIPTDDIGDLNVETIHIFNRLGNLMALVDPSSQGWDGNVNGRPMAASDYWFRAVSFDNQVIQGHFTLKR